MSLSKLQSLVTADFDKVNQTIISSLESRVPTVQQIGHYLIESGGKRIRPLLVLLCAKALQLENDHKITMATVVEFIHTATLLHDDVVDGSKIRRGKLTANHVWDNVTAILVGDFLYSRSFQLMVTVGNMQILQILADATNVIAEGEVIQISHKNQPNISEQNYLHVIQAKTAKLFEAGAQIAAVLAKTDKDTEQSFANYGLHLGTTFQLVDDLLDYQADSSVLGKNIGDDLAEGKITLPLIYALQNSEPKVAQCIKDALINNDISHIETIKSAITNSGAIDYTMQVAERHANLAIKALSKIPNSEYKTALQDLVEFAVKRNK